MTNKEAVEQFDQSHGVIIDKLIWIAGSIDNSELKDFLYRLNEKDWLNLFPDIFRSEYFKEYEDDEQFIQALIDYQKFGFTAEIHIPRCSNFRFNYDNTPLAWSVNRGNCRVEYVYAETTDELLKEIKNVSDKVFSEYLAKEAVV